MTESREELTRRMALALLSAAGAAGLAAGAHPAVAGLADPPPDPGKYIFGYGSLIQIASRTRTVPSAFAAAPAIVKGITRGWYYQADSPSLNPTYLGAVDDAKATTNGVIYHVTDSDSIESQESTGYAVQRVYTNRTIEKLFETYANTKFFLAKDNLYEVIITR